MEQVLFVTNIKIMMNVYQSEKRERYPKDVVVNGERILSPIVCGEVRIDRRRMTMEEQHHAAALCTHCIPTYSPEAG